MPEKLELKPEALSCLKYSWKLISEGPFQIRLVYIVYIVIHFLVNHYLEFLVSDFDIRNVLSFSAMYYLALYCIVFGPLSYGLFYALLRAVRGEELKVKHLFSFFENCWDVVFSIFIMVFIIVSGIAALIVPGIILACRLAFVPFLVMDKKENAINAIKQSWFMTKGFARVVFLIHLPILAVAIVQVLIIFILTSIGINPTFLSPTFTLIYYLISLWTRLATASLYHAVSLKK